MTSVERTVRISASAIELACIEQGDPSDPAVLLIMGLGAQLVHWPDGFVDALLGRRLHVVRFDNRDSGRSSRCSGGPSPDFQAALRGDFSSAAYTLSDMAADAVGVLNGFGIEAAHVVGASMGGAIAQMVAIEHSSRVLSLTSMMFTTGDPTVGQAHPEVLKALTGGPPAITREAFIERAIRLAVVLAPKASPPDLAAVARTSASAFDRGHDEQATARQAIATLASGDRTSRLHSIRVPALVVHGREDRLCDPSGGVATAQAIPGARLELMAGMGHGLPPALWGKLAELIAGIVSEGETRRQQGRGRRRAILSKPVPRVHPLL